MNQIREIVTKAVVAKGKKTVNLTANIKSDKPIYSILGCMVINNNYNASKSNDEALINGKFELNVWYSTASNSETSVLKQIVVYEETVKTRQIVNDFISENDDILIKVTAHPICKDVKIIDEDNVAIEIEFELIADVIGETKIQVNILDNVDIFVEEEKDFTKQINQDYIGRN